MIKNYFKIGWRNMMKNKFFSFINIFGLSVGLACCILIALYLNYETSYDSQHKNAPNIYQVVTAFIQSGSKRMALPNTPAPMAAALKREYPEIVETARLLSLFTEDKTIVQYNPAQGERRSFLEQRGFLADNSFFKIFTYQFTEGSPVNALANPRTVVISQQLANKLFGSQPALNKVIHVNSNTNGEQDYTVTGVFEAGKTPSHIDANFFLSVNGGNMEGFIKRQQNDFASNNLFFTYLLLKPGTDAAKLQAKLPAFINKYASKDLKNIGFRKEQSLLALRDIHLTSEVDSNVTPPASKTYLYVLFSIAVFTLIIACINFMNLSTARSSKRSSEVGVRKVLGAEKSTLIKQFLGESILMTLIAFVFAIALTLILLPLFNQVSGRAITLSFSRDLVMFFEFLLMALITGILAGSYPAFYLSSFNPVKVLKGKLTNSLAVVAVRKGLVVFQFIISVVLIVASVVIARQMNYMRTADLGFAKDQQIIVPLRTGAAKAAYTALKTVLEENSSIASIGGSAYYPGIFNPSDNLVYKDGQTSAEGRRTRMNFVDDNFLQTLNIRPVAGRLFSPEFHSDTNNNIIINEKAVQEYGFGTAQNAINKKLYNKYQDNTSTFTIIGVVKDFHYEDLHLPVTPYGFFLNTSGFNYMVIHAKPGNMAAVLKTIETSWKKYDTSDPFDYSFLDEDFNKNYKADTRLAAIVSYFTVVAIVISCLGLFGLAAFSAEQRTKEIGVRKVLGASVKTIVSLLSIDFLKLIVASIVVASPIAWWLMNKWLQGFSYRREIDWTIFALTGGIAILIGLITICSQALKAALANPVKSLRSE
ncbi:ABC transporter permease [Mucilaginibacter phyllosphaerae]|uniref:ABC transport system permease protein n=1 Tax=Mucilaginibacter phyllosphaerae TaxID=1812349 RepID=A0A4Y8A7E3_9SPHI|nr:ABC transporter permease [Mucilaginibacter phyllosphaerae]MBB3970794.1 putative ABC transport system permease protein [Mucilaginibacter phyllosphaerae]TEW64266.1 ABC transporter permease [Mucilaginibacter phyllosphaerae]GGH04641.1 ABC transporter permease [Mucilaginibacter phyllosphaerae]